MPDNDAISLEKTDIGKITKARSNVRLALEASADWRKQAKEDYLFVQGKQWDDKDVELMKKQKRILDLILLKIRDFLYCQVSCLKMLLKQLKTTKT